MGEPVGPLRVWHEALVDVVDDGVWCWQCSLPSAVDVEVRVYALTAAGVTLLRTRRRATCLQCGARGPVRRA